MASKFMRIKRIVIPLITLVILVSQISGCAIMNRDDAAGILADNDEVVVEYAEPDEENPKMEVLRHASWLLKGEGSIDAFQMVCERFAGK